jgi:hypothetical protein
MWTHTNVFYISYIYKPATSSHVKPGLFETTTLTLLLASSRMFSFRKSSRTVIPELVLQYIPECQRFPKFVASQVHNLESSRIRQLQGLAGSRLRAIACSRLRDFESSGVQFTAHSWLRDFANSRLQIFMSSLPLKTCITNFISLDVSRVTSFHEFPNTRLNWRFDLTHYKTTHDNPGVHGWPHSPR